MKERGNSTVEFTLVSTLVLFLFLLVLQVGFLLHTRTVLVAAAQAIADGWLAIYYAPRLAGMYDEGLDEGFAPGTGPTPCRYRYCNCTVPISRGMMPREAADDAYGRLVDRLAPPAPDLPAPHPLVDRQGRLPLRARSHRPVQARPANPGRRPVPSVRVTDLNATPSAAVSLTRRGPRRHRVRRR